MPDVIEAGTQHMDGTTALAYVRSRKADSDYQRMRRQRDVLGALAPQVTLADALSGYTAVTSALGDSLHTSLSTDEFANFIDLLGAETSIVESVGLEPTPGRPEQPELHGDGQDRRPRPDSPWWRATRRATDPPAAGPRHHTG